MIKVYFQEQQVLKTYVWSQEFLQRSAYNVGKVLHEVTWSLKHTQHFFICSRYELKSANRGQALHVIAMDLRPGDLMPGDLDTPIAQMVSNACIHQKWRLIWGFSNLISIYGITSKKNNFPCECLKYIVTHWHQLKKCIIIYLYLISTIINDLTRNKRKIGYKSIQL